MAKRTFANLDHHIWRITYKWAKRRHPRKNRRWVVNHYYGVDQGRGWDPGDGRNRLLRHNETRVSRFVKVRGKASPFDPSLRDYWEDRRTRRLVREASHFHRVHLLQRQAGRCAACKAVFDPDLEQGGNTNIVVRRDPPPEIRPAFSSTVGAVPDGPRGRPCMRWPMLEPYAEKPARTVLRGLGGPQGLPGYPTLSFNHLRRHFNNLETSQIMVDVAQRISNLF